MDLSLSMSACTKSREVIATACIATTHPDHPKPSAFFPICFIRQHPEICAFPSREFYDGKLRTGYSSLWGGELLSFWPNHPSIAERPVPHLLVDVRGEEETLTVTTDQGNERSKSNRLEAEKVVCSADWFLFLFLTP